MSSTNAPRTSSESGSLAGQVALVTGGGRGLGPFLATALAEAGAAVAVAARTTAEVQAAAARIVAAGGRALAVTADVTDRTAVDRMVAEVEQQLAPVDVLVNNAGLFRALGPVWDVDPEVWWRDVEVNLRGPFLCTHAVLGSMMSRQRGRIIHVASYAGTGPLPAASAYAASKAGLLRLTDTLAAEVQGHGISVFAINPGTLRTPMNDYLLASEVVQEWAPWFPQIFAEGRETPPDPAMRLVVALASGVADVLSGRFVDVGEDVAQVVQRAETITSEDLYVLRLRTEQGSP